MADFDFNALPPPEDIAWPIYPPDSPARRLDEESKEAFNEAAARASFGDAYIDWLMAEQRWFRGDWWLLAMLLRCAAWAEQNDPERIDPKRFASLPVHSLPRLVYLHLERANLKQAHLERAFLAKAHLEHAVLQQAHLEHASLFNAHLVSTFLFGAHLEHAVLSRAHLERADLAKAHLKHADLEQAHLKHANLFDAHLEHADLSRAHLEHANLEEAHLEQATLWQTVLDHANLRGARDILFDDNPVERLDIEGDAPDPWSVLRRKYTGPMFFVHLLLVVAFLLPYAAKVLALTVTARGYDAARAMLDEQGTGTPHGAWLAEWVARFDAAHTDTHALWVLLGGTQEAACIFVFTAVAIIIYNILRAYLTIRVGVLRDQADRVLRTPTLEEYYGPYHPLAGEKAGLKRVPAVWWRGVRAWRLAISIDDEDKREIPSALRRDPRTSPWRWRWQRLSLLNPFPVLGLWHIHQVARVLFWISVASVLLHVGNWLLTTTVPVPHGN